MTVGGERGTVRAFIGCVRFQATGLAALAALW